MCSVAMWNRDAYSWQGHTDPLYKSIPFFIGLRGGIAYGVFFDNTHRSSFDFGKESDGVLSFGAVGVSDARQHSRLVDVLTVVSEIAGKPDEISDRGSGVPGEQAFGVHLEQLVGAFALYWVGDAICHLGRLAQVRNRRLAAVEHP